MQIQLTGTEGQSDRLVLENRGAKKFQRGGVDTFVVDVQQDLGEVQQVTVSLCGECTGDGWIVDNILVTDLMTSQSFNFRGNPQVMIKPGDSYRRPSETLTRGR